MLLVASEGWNRSVLHRMWNGSGHVSFELTGHAVQVAADRLIHGWGCGLI